MAEKTRASFTKEERREALEATNTFARDTIAAEQKARSEKTERLRLARLGLMPKNKDSERS